MTEEKGAEVGGENNNGATTENKEQGDNNLLLEQYKKELSTRDKAITEMQKKLKAIEEEKQVKDLATKTAEEQLRFFKEKADKYERERAYNQTFKENGLDVSNFDEILNEKDPVEQAKKFANILKSQIELNKEQAVKTFKEQTLEKVDKAQFNSTIPLDATLEMLKSKGLL